MQSSVGSPKFALYLEESWLQFTSLLQETRSFLLNYGSVRRITCTRAPKHATLLRQRGESESSNTKEIMVAFQTNDHSV